MVSAMAATVTARAFPFCRTSDFSPTSSPPLKPHHLFSPPLPRINTSTSCLTRCCVSSSGGGISDDYFVSTAKSTFDRGFCVISNMLKRIEPLDSSIISKGVSDSAKDSMKQTISTMLGLLPSDHFSVSVSVSKPPLYALLVSAVITGYTLWNAEYRMSLTRNLEIPLDDSKELNSLEKEKQFVEEEQQEKDKQIIQKQREFCNTSFSDLQISPQVLGDLSPQALNYIQNLQSQLSIAHQELDAQKKQTMQIECNKGSRNDLLEYLRSLDSEMVSELSRPSSAEVEDIIHQLVQNVVRRFFKDDPASCFTGDSAVANTENHKDSSDEFCDSMGTSRDYLAKLLFWCMLLGHHLRGLENRLHLSCVVGLL